MKKNIIILTELGKRNSGSGHFLRSLILKKTLNSKNCKLLIQNNKNIKKNLISNYKDLHLINQESNARKFVKKDLRSFFVIDALEKNAVDPIGCGDALIAYASLGLYVSKNPLIASVLGSISASITSTINGNLPVSKKQVQKKLDQN